MTIPEHTRQPLGPNQERWLQALESGKYTQGEGKLRSDNTFCCLGIGCVIAELPGKSDSNGDWYFQGSDGSWDRNYAPSSLVWWLALRSNAGDSQAGGESLVLLNDGDKCDQRAPKSFSEIAAIIRADPSVYFKEPR